MVRLGLGLGSNSGTELGLGFNSTALLLSLAYHIPHSALYQPTQTHNSRAFNFMINTIQFYLATILFSHVKIVQNVYKTKENDLFELFITTGHYFTSSQNAYLICLI